IHLTIHYLDPLPDIVESDRKLLAEAARVAIAAEIARSSAKAPHRL
ncbi:MAG: 1-acyl-sn-glycerol-3-phosphate acyltransferase, partial [Sphingomonadales bacterium]